MLRKASLIGILATVLVLSSLTVYAATPPQMDSSLSSIAASGIYADYIFYFGEHDIYYHLSSVEKERTAQTARNVVDEVSGTSYNVCWTLFHGDTQVSTDFFHRDGDYTYNYDTYVNDGEIVDLGARADDREDEAVWVEGEWVP